MNNRTGYLMKNTALFALGNLGTKIISFFLIPLYTKVLTTEQYGIVDLVVTISTIVVPILSLNIAEAVMRFNLDKDADKDKITNAEWKKGLLMEDKLHSELIKFVGMETTFEELSYHINELILREGFINLDFMGNLGHSIVKDKDDRIYTEKGNTKMISDVKYFTFEPHVSIPGSKYGFKKENIYYFENGKLVEL